MQAATSMYDFENHGQEWDVEQFVTWLLGLDGDVAGALEVECQRALLLADGHYARVGRALVMNPVGIAAVAFVQGATFAAAALGAKPEPI
jgi:hypothetical protein